MPLASAPIRCDHVASVFFSEAVLAPAPAGSTSTSASKTRQAGAATRDADLFVFESGKGLVPPVIAAIVVALVVLALLVALVVLALLIPGLVVGLRVVSFLIDLLGSSCDVIGGALLVDALLSGLRGAVGRSRSRRRRRISVSKRRCDADPARKREERRDHGELLPAHRASFRLGPTPDLYLMECSRHENWRRKAPKTPLWVDGVPNLRRSGAKSLPSLATCGDDDRPYASHVVPPGRYGLSNGGVGLADSAAQLLARKALLPGSIISMMTHQAHPETPALQEKRHMVLRLGPRSARLASPGLG
jgi:hypothetical protein